MSDYKHTVPEDTRVYRKRQRRWRNTKKIGIETEQMFNPRKNIIMTVIEALETLSKPHLILLAK